MADKNLLRMSARELARLIASRAVSPVEVLDAYLAAIESLNPQINAVVTLAAEQARDAARRAEEAVMKGEALGALHGVPIGVKDITPTAGIRTTYVSPLYKDYVPAEDAEAVRRLKAAGAIVVGENQHAGIRRWRQYQQRAVRADTKSVEYGIERRWFFGRLRCGRRCTHVADRARHGFRRLGSRSRRVLRHCRHPRDAGPGAELSAALAVGSGTSSWSARAGRRRRGAVSRCPRRLFADFPDLGRPALAECGGSAGAW